MATLILQKIRCISSIRDQGDLVSLEVNGQRRWSSLSPMIPNQEFHIGQHIRFGSSAQIRLVNTDTQPPTSLGTNPVSNLFIPNGQCEFNLIPRSDYILFFAVDADVPAIALVLFVVAEFLSAVVAVLLRVIDVLRYLERTITRRYQQQIGIQPQIDDPQQPDDINSVE